MESLEVWVQQIPKIELHLHLEGSIRPHLLRVLAEKNGVYLPPQDENDEDPAYRYSTFLEFLQCFKTACSVLKTPEDIALVAENHFDELIRQNVVHSEIYLSPVIHERNGISTLETMRLVSEIAKQKHRNHGFRCLFLFDGVRQWGVESFALTVKLAEECQPWGVAGIGIGGDEASIPAVEFTSIFQRAKDAGLHRTVHAGEACGKESVEEALNTLKPERIGHGIRAADEPLLLKRIRDEGVTLDMSLTSNYKTGVCPSMAEHPISKIWKAGVSLTLNTDDPALFATDLTSEYLLGSQLLGLDRSGIAHLVRGALRSSFLPAAEKATLEDSLPGTLTE